MTYTIDNRYAKVSLDNDGVERVREIVNRYYNYRDNTEIVKAIKDIQTYATYLKLYDYIKYSQSNKLYNIIRKFDNTKRSASVEIYNVKVENKTNMNIENKNGQVKTYANNSTGRKV